MDLVREWWLRCERQPQYHSRCSRTLSGCRAIDTNRTPLPRRCICVAPLDAGVADSSDFPLDFRLEKTEGGRGQYICLSHRWVQPDTRQSSTTKSNYQARLAGIGFSQLPPLFIHTLRAAAKFGIRYVWIDSLCIIQDDADDWNQESRKMGKYYQLATFTLTSTFSSEDTASFDGYSPPKLQRVVRLPYRDKTGRQRGYFYVYPRARRSVLAAEWTSHITSSGLLTRGWIFQEWLLSRRIVCLTPSGVYVQCQCRHPAATQNQYGEDVGGFVPDRCRGLLPIKASLRLSFDTSGDLYCTWEAVVEHYSGLTFSQPGKDRITALAGVAGEFATALKSLPDRGEAAHSSKFIAGLWTGDLARGLLWGQAQPGPHRRLEGFPTWSWASIDVSVRWPLRKWDGEAREHARGKSELATLHFVDDAVEWNRTRTTANISLSADVISCRRSFTSLMHQSAVALGSAVCNAAAVIATPEINSGNLLDKNILDLRGRLQPVFIGQFMEKHCGQESQNADNDAGPVAGVTPTTPTTPTTSARPKLPFTHRTVTIPNTQPLISGWASLEHPDFQDENIFSPPSTSASSHPSSSSSSSAARPPTLVFALLVSTQAATPSSTLLRAEKYYNYGRGTGLDFATPTKNEFNVLFLRSCPPTGDPPAQLVVNGYERIGMGLLFGEHAKRGFDLATERELQLV